LAVQVEDHPLDYATFEGEIPKGEYGAGSVEIWDTGTYELVEEKHNGGLTVRLHGEKLDGTWALVPAKLSGDPKNWLILRKREDGTGAARRDYKPMLATLEDEKSMPRGEGWEFEIKWDGYRIVARVASGEAELRTRKDQDYTQRFANVAKELEKALKTPDAVLDGEDRVGSLERLFELFRDVGEALRVVLVLARPQLGLAARDPCDDPVAVPLDLELPALAARHALLVLERRQHRLVVAPRRAGPILALAQDQPVLGIARELRG